MSMNPEAADMARAGLQETFQEVEV